MKRETPLDAGRRIVREYVPYVGRMKEMAWKITCAIGDAGDMAFRLADAIDRDHHLTRGGPRLDGHEKCAACAEIENIYPLY